MNKNAHTAADRLSLLEPKCVELDFPAKYVARLSLNRVSKRNALNHHIRYQIFYHLALLDQNPDIRVTIIRGNGPDFCSGYDLNMKEGDVYPNIESPGIGMFQRSVLQGWFSIMDLAKPVIAQVHGNCLAGGLELAAACDVVFTANTCRIGYPPVRSMGLPDTQILPFLIGHRNAMKLMLTGDCMSGEEAAQWGFATESFPLHELESKTLEFAQRASRVPIELQQFNKRSVHRALEAKGMRTCLRQGSDLQALSFSSPTARAFMARFDGKSNSIKEAFVARDKDFENTKSKL